MKKKEKLPKEQQARNDAYNEYVKQVTPTHNLWANMAKAFVLGGAICLLGGQVESDFLFDLAKNMPRRIVTVRKISQTPPKYPRPSAKIAKNPLK